MIWLAAAIIFAAAVYALCWWGAGIILHPPAMSPMWIFPEQFGLRYEKVAFKTRDGLELKGWFIPSTAGEKRTIVMCHGWGDNKGELLKQTYFLNEYGGFNLLYFDFRSHGESEGEITTIGGLEMIDFDAAIEWLRKAKPELSDSIGVFGLSMGAAVTVASLPKHPDLRCAVVESPFSDYRTVIKRWAWNNMKLPYYPLVAITLLILRSRVKDPEIDLFNPVEAAPKIAPRPLFVIGGEFDRLMTPEDVRKIFDSAREPKQLWMVPEAWHAKCREAAGMEYDTRVIGFFSRNL
ncbi:MAG: alpha/beta fold hydrolase [Elusimicrobiota bacterium]|nr:alpha/beta fold hydrolase [Elusimicrobiota bacterium]